MCFYDLLCDTEKSDFNFSAFPLPGAKSWALMSSFSFFSNTGWSMCSARVSWPAVRWFIHNGCSLCSLTGQAVVRLKRFWYSTFCHFVYTVVEGSKEPTAVSYAPETRSLIFAAIVIGVERSFDRRVLPSLAAHRRGRKSEDQRITQRIDV